MHRVLTIITAVALAAAAYALDENDKRAAVEKKGEAAKEERAADLDVMRSYERVSPSLEVAVFSCRAVQPPAKPAEKKETPVTVGGGDWAALAGALLSAAERETTPSPAKAAEGRVFIHIEFGVKNVGAGTILVAPADFTLVTPDGYAVPFNVRTFDAANGFAGVYLPAQTTSGGTLVFAVEPYPEYTLHYYNATTKAEGAKHVLLMVGD